MIAVTAVRSFSYPDPPRSRLSRSPFARGLEQRETERLDNEDVCYVNTLRPPDVLATSSVFMYLPSRW